MDGGHIDWATGAILLVPATARETVGDWDESFFLYSEELDYLAAFERPALRSCMFLKLW